MKELYTLKSVSPTGDYKWPCIAKWWNLAMACVHKDEPGEKHKGSCGEFTLETIGIYTEHEDICIFGLSL